MYVNNSRHSPETFPSPVKAVIWIEYLDSPLILRCNTVRSQLHSCCYLVFILVASAPEICYSLKPSKNGRGLLTPYPHLTTHRPIISFHQFPQTTFTHFQGTQCQHIALNLTMAHEHNIAQHHIETPNKHCQMELLTRGMSEGSVVEDAVERNSWGKSRCEQMCHFPITGGLHRTSGDAPLETPTLQNPVPVWCHVHKSNSSSSK